MIQTETDFITALIVGEIIIQLLGQNRAWTYSRARWIGITATVLSHDLGIRERMARIHLCTRVSIHRVNRIISGRSQKYTRISRLLSTICISPPFNCNFRNCAISFGIIANDKKNLTLTIRTSVKINLDKRREKIRMKKKSAQNKHYLAIRGLSVYRSV